MHTSTRLEANDFAYWRVTQKDRSPLSFGEFCTDYHQLDRIGVVSPALEDGVFHVGRALLALTTAFYDSHRSRGGEFFDYPQHFAFVGANDVDTYTQSSQLWGAWGWLDVWPANKWITATPNATSMLKCVFDYQINRLFWPQNLWPAPGEELLPDYAYQMLDTRLKAIYSYSPTAHLDATVPTLEVYGSPAVETLLQESIERLPESVIQNRHCALSEAERLQQVPVAEFIAKMQSVALYP
ncbi:hypothetical protein KFU94_60445 [Chloroflexi bacterium TSY]|nr:hypothetical protein [Chloroflexi bacterium TSY]